MEAESIGVRGTGGDEMLRCLIGHQEILGTYVDLRSTNQ